jgi:MerR family transcriptional regulator, copper efflux regulator
MTGAALSRRAIAARLGLGIGALLFYERSGLIPPPRRAPNGYRLYTELDADRLALIVKTKSLGFSLREIAQLLDGVEEGLDVGELREGVLRKAEELQKRIDELEDAKSALLDIAKSPKLGSCDSILAVMNGEKAVPRG